MPRIQLNARAFDQLWPDPRKDAKDVKFREFEHSVFDNAIAFRVFAFHGRGNKVELRFEPDELFAAMEAALANERACLYAVNAVGRSIVIDRQYFDYWQRRRMHLYRCPAQ